VFEPRRSFDLSGWLEQLRARAALQLEERLQMLPEQDLP
jgi:hypothetical protein